MKIYKAHCFFYVTEIPKITELPCFGLEWLNVGGR